MAKRSETDRSDANDDGDDSGEVSFGDSEENSGDDSDANEGAGRCRNEREDRLTHKEVRDAIVHLKDRNGSSVQDIRRYLTVEFDRFKNVPVVDLEVDVRKAASKGVQNGTIANNNGRFLLAGLNSEEQPVPGAASSTTSKRNRRRRGACRVRKRNRAYCSRFKKRCCRRRRRCRASRHRSKRPVCSRYKSACCRRRIRRR